jgi:putative ABC transport system substrate-binding protein
VRLTHQAIQLGLAAIRLSLGFPTEGQQSSKMPRVGYLAAPSLSSMSARTEAFREGLRELGDIEGKNLLLIIDTQKENLIVCQPCG